MLLIDPVSYFGPFQSWVSIAIGPVLIPILHCCHPITKKPLRGLFLFPVYIGIMSTGSIPAIPTHHTMNVLSVANHQVIWIHTAHV